jgi:hypothetical protein
MGRAQAQISADMRADLLSALRLIQQWHQWNNQPPKVPSKSRLVVVPELTKTPGDGNPHTNAILVLGPNDTVKTAKKAYFESFEGGYVGLSTYSNMIDIC